MADFNIIKTVSLARKVIKDAGDENGLAYIKLIKLMYLIERKMYELFRRFITGDQFYSMDHGPVLSTAYNLITSSDVKISEEENSVYYKNQLFWNTHFKKERYNILSEKTNNLDHHLSEEEVKVAENTLYNFKDMKWQELVKWTHENCGEWRNPNGSSIPITHEDIRRNVSGVTIEDLAAKMEKEMEYITS